MQGHIGANLGVIAAVAAILAAAMTALDAPWWAWTGFAAWGLLWVTAASGLSDEASRKFLAGTLRKSNFTQIYTTLARRNVIWIWTRLCDPAPDNASLPALFRAALTWRLYDAALLLAIAYPILLLVGQWVVTGEEGRVGSYIVLPEDDFWLWRLSILLIAILLPAVAFVSIKAFATTPQTFGNIRGDWLFLFLFVNANAGTVLGVAAGVIPFPGGGGGALLFAIVISFLFAFTFAFSFGFSLAFVLGFVISLPFSVLIVAEVLGALAGAFAGALAATFAFVTEFFVRLGKPRLARIFLTAAVIAAMLLTTTMLEWAGVPEDRRSLFLFLAILPLINALFDVISYAVTLSLVRRGLRAKLPFLFGLADLAIACLLLLGLGAVLVAVIHGLNLLAGVLLLDLPAVFEGVQADPGAYVWLYLMLFSTLLPTLLHGALSLLGVQGIWPRRWRRPVADWVEAAPASPLHAIRASLGLSLIWALPLLGLVFVLWVIWHHAQPALMAGLQLYLDSLLWIAGTPVGAI